MTEYDFGDWWEHSVEILNCIDDYEGECPVVTKFRQASPPDDCGGIYGYYEFLEQYNDVSNPEHDSIVEWAKEQGYSGEYNIEFVNDEIAELVDFDPDEFCDFM